MTAVPRAADLPYMSVVVDDRRGLAWYAGPRGVPGRWSCTGVGKLRAVEDDEIDAAVLYGAVVLRVGDGTEKT